MNPAVCFMLRGRAECNTEEAVVAVCETIGEVFSLGEDRLESLKRDSIDRLWVRISMDKEFMEKKEDVRASLYAKDVMCVFEGEDVREPSHEQLEPFMEEDDTLTFEE